MEVSLPVDLFPLVFSRDEKQEVVFFRRPARSRRLICQVSFEIVVNPFIRDVPLGEDHTPGPDTSPPPRLFCRCDHPFLFANVADSLLSIESFCGTCGLSRTTVFSKRSQPIFFPFDLDVPPFPAPPLEI